MHARLTVLAGRLSLSLLRANRLTSLIPSHVIGHQALLKRWVTRPQTRSRPEISSIPYKPMVQRSTHVAHLHRSAVLPRLQGAGFARMRLSI